MCSGSVAKVRSCDRHLACSGACARVCLCVCVRVWRDTSPIRYGQLTLVRLRVSATNGSSTECISSGLTMRWRNSSTMLCGLQAACDPTHRSITLVRCAPLELDLPTCRKDVPRDTLHLPECFKRAPLEQFGADRQLRCYRPTFGVFTTKMTTRRIKME
jgi:hypothetical protein